MTDDTTPLTQHNITQHSTDVDGSLPSEAEPVELHLPQDLSLSVSVLTHTYSPILPLLLYILYSQYVTTKQW
ncbi:hypothetical protein VNO80_21999 [Phaseolus coccineus]|uniref:Uncharacterized protein n=1 Tax=Phaseolus coccineus TaxID=3886 RepID=A0AAN9M765_PHACN